MNNKPAPDAEACVNTPPQDAYWGLFWADGSSSSWIYSTLGVSGLTVQDGQAVGFSWQAGSGSTPPGVKPPTTATPSSSPSAKPSSSGEPSSTPKPSTAPGSSDAPSSAAPSSSAAADDSASRSPSAGRSAKDKAKKKAKADRTESAAASETPSTTSACPSPLAAATADPPAPGGDGGLPAWEFPALLVALAGAGGATAYLRRRAGGSTP